MRSGDAFENSIYTETSDFENETSQDIAESSQFESQSSGAAPENSIYTESSDFENETSRDIAESSQFENRRSGDGK